MAKQQAKQQAKRQTQSTTGLTKQTRIRIAQTRN